MKNSIIIFTMLVLIFTGCEDEMPSISECTAPIYLEENSAIISDPFRVTSAVIEDNCLFIEVNAGGCDGESWEGTLFIFPDVAESYPPQVTAEFALKDQELCEASIRRTFSFDLSGLSTISDRVILNLRGWDSGLLYPGFNTDDIVNKWDLININGGLLGTDLRFSRGEVTWEFEERQVVITDDTGDDVWTGFDSGTYDYNLFKSDTYFQYYELEIDGNSLGAITYLNSDSLIVDQRAVDGFQYVLISSDE